MADLFEHWRDEPPIGLVVRAHLGFRAPAHEAPVDTTPKEISEAEWRAMCAENETEALHRGGPRNPFL